MEGNKGGMERKIGKLGKRSNTRVLIEWATRVIGINLQD